MPYGTMGGEGQPQTQAAVFSRYGLLGQELQRAVTAPRWLLGRTWGAGTTNLKIESRIGDDVIEALRAAGHDVEVVAPFSDMMGHAGPWCCIRTARSRGHPTAAPTALSPRSEAAGNSWQKNFQNGVAPAKLIG